MELQLFNVKEVGKRLKINPSAVYQLIKSGHLRALKLGSLKVTSTELERFFKYAEGKDFTDLNNVKELQSDK
ncbi:helix-turn-helix domain-containing protein [Clostridium tertium]|uniref:helix-turn-helix domain-containing protein n=2 Tax=Clostridium TaxID=1485 RepID=UPI0023306DB2|nr:helix-turn-helix domain-containing protein [Clostridium tertium]MDB1955916.1 helix-turn-helix domain-containing protein [Clostridium tertium]MDB1960508.1 helix-turn-helix domain-containing protein [Clostridium tertium]MDB1964230.1 helix-turn-helix domain-containing protein [Clostridium tertium]MDB1966355.1 helix-turn-helix domain-containing protein [Clostridium tertium]